MCVCVHVFTNTPAQAECDRGSIFRPSLTGLNSIILLLNQLPYQGLRTQSAQQFSFSWVYTFPKDIGAKWNNYNIYNIYATYHQLLLLLFLLSNIKISMTSWKMSYWFYDIQQELVDKHSIINCFPCTFCPILGYHQGCL